ncbi:MAG: serpin family protein [Oscillospiraceae bacterium]|nr:serpin family protein [Oscillospiraceae bacterium]
MKKKRIVVIITSVLLVFAIAAQMTFCAAKIQAKDLMKDITPNPVEPMKDLSEQNPQATDFAVRLLQASEESGKNTLISPLSVMSALSMTANGAKGETLSQMENVLGMTLDELNLYLYSYVGQLPQGDKYKLSVANSLWVTEKDSFTVNREFLQINADYYGADVYQAPFTQETSRDINKWVKQNTDGMVEKIVEDVPADAIMYLVNALAFDAEWMEIYEKDQVRNGTFTKEDGSEQSVDFMHCSEHEYLEDENATGFMKRYRGGYAFVALLPKEGISVSEYVASLDGEALHTMLSEPQSARVYTSIPKFETGYEVDMGEILSDMGMPKAFDPNHADFQEIGTADGIIYIDEVLHKTFISVGEKGTRAGAATVVEMKSGSAIVEKTKEVHLNRPFVYMLIDCENYVPFFIGTMMDVG